MVHVLLCCFYVLLFVWIIYKNPFFRLPGIAFPYLVVLFLLKILMATWLWNIFTTRYPASDADVFFNDSEVIYEVLFQDSGSFFQLFFGVGDNPVVESLRAKMQIWNNSYGTLLIHDSRTMIRLNVIFRFFSFGYFYVHAIFMCLLSFIGLVYIYKLFYPYLKKLNALLIISCFLLPSVLFWSSAVLKEGIVFLGLGLLLYHVQCGLRTHYTWKNIMGLVLGTALLILIKIYVLIALCPALLANLWITASNHRYIVFKYMMSYLFFLILIFSSRFISPSLDFVKIVKNKQADFINVAKGGMVLFHDSTYIYLDYDVREERLQAHSEHLYKLKKGFQYASFKPGGTDTILLDGTADTSSFKVLYTYVPAGSAIVMQKLKPSLLELLKSAPVAFFNALVIPSLFTYRKAFTGFLLTENLLLMLFPLVILVFFLKSRFPMAITFFCFSFVIILFALIGLTTPVLGALVRYRIPGIPFFMAGCMLMADEGKIIAFYNRVKANLIKK